MSRMVNLLVLPQQQQRLPVLASLYPCRLPTIHTRSANSVSESQRKWNIGFKAPRRLVLGLGASFWSQFMSMAGRARSNHLIALAKQKGVIEEVLKNVDWPQQFPFKEEDFQRFDESPDSLFYDAPRFVTHIDDPAIAALTKYYSKVFPPSNTPGVCILDMCSSWVSHFPKGYKQYSIVGLGMNEEELKRNPVLTEYAVQDLNLNPKLPFEDNSFDVITNAVSVDYLAKPIDVFKEMCRVLKPGGLAIMSFSNRCFWTKAISIWTSTGDADHVMIVGSYFHYSGGFEPPQAVDISPNPGRSDPMYVVYSRKASTA
ncbi:hypothetical protein D5086_013085 [Populus alba]|uniref:Methyltransferase type 11 domain-containing protein n=3 Tax=Populus TaxID=3689 RepID=A0A4U5QRG6_POPAL|nr:uncharacterized protein LOC118047939 isoform X1 [Populus alba]KAG6772064.1 hypothetical protein POTOM_023460 [Populus tomentosa]TKS13524.1 hypothetical protein D5086_0000052770 [Populus alba]